MKARDFSISLQAILVAVFVFCAAMPVYPVSPTDMADQSRIDTFNVIYFDKVPFISMVDLAETYRLKLSYDPLALSMTARRGESELTLSHLSRTAVHNGASKNIVLAARLLRGSVYVPVPTALPLFSEMVPGTLTWDEKQRAVMVTGVVTTIGQITSENFANGALICFPLAEPLEYKLEKKQNNWLTVSFDRGSFEPDGVFKELKTDLIRDARCFQHEDGAEISFHLSEDVEDYGLAQSDNQREVLLSLRKKRESVPITYSRTPAEPLPIEPGIELEVIRIDTIVIDPGHGGKDPGAVGPKKTKEKDIVLSVALELKKIIDKRGEIKTVLTRDRDVFVPLHKRAEIARKSNGKLFISLHANASRNKRAKGFEVYFLSAAKTKDAEEVARRENKAVELEENLEHYADFLHLANLPKEIRDIQIDMESSVYLKESQDICRIILDSACASTKLNRRGVKQAGFLVMSGTHAFMPSILVEIGFISNANEEKLLKRASYQKKLAEAIYEAVITFKTRHERGLFSGG